MLKLSSVALTVVLLLGSLVWAEESAQTDDSCRGWTGLWRLAPVNEGEGSTFHFTVSPEKKECRVDFFGRDFSRSDNSPGVDLKEGKLEFSSPVRGTSFRVSLARQEDECSGQVSMLHPQYQSTFEHRGWRVSKQAAWKPVSPIEDEMAPKGGIVDLAGLLLEKTPIDSLDSLERFWRKEIEPTYFALVQDVVLGARGGVKERHDWLAGVFKQLEDPAWRERIREVSELHREVVEEIRESAPDLYHPNLFIVLPTLGGQASDVLRLGGWLVVRIGLDALPEEPERSRAWLAKEHLKVGLYQALQPADPSLASAVIREGLATYWAVSLGLASQPTDVLIDAPGGGAAEASTPEQRRAVLKAIRGAARGSDLPSADVTLVGFDFAKRLTAVYGVQELLAKTRFELGTLLLEFVNEKSSPAG